MTEEDTGDQVSVSMDPSSRGTTRPNGQKSGPKKSLLVRIESVLKLAGVAGVVAALMGLPAVHVHFSRLNVPSYFIDYQIVLRAGIMPAIILALIAGYVIWTSNEIRESGKLSSLHSTLFVPLMLTCLPIFAIGFLGYLLLLSWYLMWFIHLAIDAIFGTSLSNRQLLYAAAGFLVVIGILTLMYMFSDRAKRSINILLSKMKFLKFIRELRAKHEDILSTSTEEVSEKDRKTLSSDQYAETTTQPLHKAQEDSEKRAKEWLYLLPLLWLFIPFIFIFMLFAVKKVIYFLGSRTF